MRLFRSIRKSFRTLMMHRLRTLLSTLGVLFGVVAVVTMLSIGEGAKQETLEQIEQLGLHNLIIRQADLSDEQLQQAREKRSQGLTLEEMRLIQSTLPHVKRTAALKVVEAQVNGLPQNLTPEVLAIDGAFAEIKGLSVKEGRFLAPHDSLRRRLVCVLGDEVAKRLGKRGHIQQTIRIEGEEFQIVGILNAKRWMAGKTSAMSTRNLNMSILIPLGSEQSLPQRLTLKQASLSEILVQIDQTEQMNSVAKAVRHLLSRTHAGAEDYRLIIPQELMEQAFRTQHTFNLVLGSIAAISLLVGGIGIMNIMLATVSERTREIGIRRAVGANRRHILTQFLSETLLLTLSGAILGVALGILFSGLISYLAGWKTIVKAWSILLSLGMAAGVGLFSGLYPALKAAAMHPIAALRND